MDSLTHFHSKNVYFYILYSYSLKVTELFFKISGLTPAYILNLPKDLSLGES